MHGHNGRLEITFEAESLDTRGMVFDFADIKRVVKGWVDDELDHRMILCRGDPLVPWLLEQGEPCHLLDENPTAENIAKAVYRHVKAEGWPVTRVRLWETRDSWAEYRE
jgi:6-pyruvoyltetrahydropterin/6-carboxytetrahydropterin synthase